jgi:hypothetical protein
VGHDLGQAEIPDECTHLITSYLYGDPVCTKARQAGVLVVRGLWVHHCMKHQELLNPHQVGTDPLCFASGAASFDSKYLRTQKPALWVACMLHNFAVEASSSQV